MNAFLIFLIFGVLFKNGLGDDSVDRCDESVDQGPCQYYSTKYYFDKATEECKQFYYGGCLGTRNRFNTKQQCMKQCLYKEHNPLVIPDLCLIDHDPGFCPDDRPGQWYYFFDADAGECKQFYYYGCGSNLNHNKFYSLALCHKVCGERLGPQVACDKCDVRTSYCKQHTKFNYTCECQNGYEKDIYDNCNDADECRSGEHKCHDNAWCTNVLGDYSCKCKAGYVGDGKSECEFVGLGKSTTDCGKCSSNASCSQGVCTCLKGFKGDGIMCEDVDECMAAPYPCDRNAQCTNKNGSFTCECPLGFAGNGYACSEDKRSCLDKFNSNYTNQYQNGNWRENYYYDHDTKRCSLFWYDGVKATSRNIFSNLQTCFQMCEESHILARSQICWDKFDTNYRNQCLNGEWEQRYYFDHATSTCRMFFFDNCKGRSRNIFDDLLTCQWLCEETPKYKAKSCLETFDQNYREECNGGRWQQRYFYDKTTRSCQNFWYDGCKGTSSNIFQDEATCISLCEKPGIEDYNLVQEIKERHQSYETTTKAIVLSVNGSESNSTTNPCTTLNPCQNGGSCHYDTKKAIAYCKCMDGFTGENCTDKSDFDPCLINPCLNGGTCDRDNSTKVGRTCFCPSKLAGINCEIKPCEPNPCLNGGKCRTTRGYKTFFCDCINNYAGKNCDHIEGSTDVPNYGKNVNMVSSGKQEWVEEMKKQFAKKKVVKEDEKKDIKLADEPVSDLTQNASHASISGHAAQVGEKDPKTGDELKPNSGSNSFSKSSLLHYECLLLLVLLSILNISIHYQLLF